MTGAEYRELRNKLGLTMLQLANAVGVYPSTVARREKLDSIDTEAELAIRSIEGQHEDAQLGAG